VVVAGRTGSGKTTTLSWMIDHINRTRAVNVVTIEDPIEVVHTDKQAIIHQREVGSDTADYAQALRRVLRQDPDVVLIGEVRDEETAWAALSAAETGHLVLTSVHTPTAVETVNRFVELFPRTYQPQVRTSFAATLRGIVCQRLVPRLEGSGRVLVQEVMLATGRIRERLADPDGDAQGSISEIMAADDYEGMITFDRHLLQLLRDGTVSPAVAVAAATNPHDLGLELRAAGLVPSG
jgi:twitching motility protein PilT